MFGIGTQEILVILALAIIVIGPKKLPEVASAMGKGFAEFRRAFDGLKDAATVDMKTARETEDLIRTYPHLAEAHRKETAAATGKEEPPAPAEKKEPPADGEPAEQTAAAEEPEAPAEPAYDPNQIES